MRDGKGASRAPVLRFTNCRILRGRRLLRWGVGPAGAASGAAGAEPAGAGPGHGGHGLGAGCWVGDTSPTPLRREDLWVRDGRILDPEKLFFEERLVADQQRDCGGCILAPGFIDVQINGAVWARGWRPRGGARSAVRPPLFCDHRWIWR